jgi:hypothetical protein
MVRTVCDLRCAAGDLIGSHAVVLRADDAIAPAADAQRHVEQLAGEDGVARVQLWTASSEQTRADTAEMQSRGKDKLIAGALVIECLRRTDAERIAGRMRQPPAALGISGAQALGIYALLCIYTSHTLGSR